MGKITGYLVGMILIGIFVGVYVISMSSFSAEYGTTFDNTSFSSYEKLNELTQDAKEIRAASNITQSSNVIDVIGGYFSGAYKALKTAGKSMDILIGSDGMLDDASQDLKLGSAGEIIVKGLGAIVIIIIIVGVLLKAATKVDL